MSAEHEKRRNAFLRDIVEVCKKHRVMIEPDGNDLDQCEALDVTFTEFDEEHALTFHVELTDLESEIRAGVWPVVHGI